MDPISRRRMPEGIHEVNMTPLIDVSLVLVVILLVATPMAFQSSLALRQAAASARAGAAVRTERIEIMVVSDQEVWVDRVRVPRADLDSVLRPRLAASSTRQVVVRCADTVSHGAFVEVLDAAKGCGAATIAVTRS